MYLRRKGYHIQWNAFTSTSLSESVASDFSQRDWSPDKIPVLFDIRRNHTHPTCANFSSFSDYADEKEVVMIPGCRFRVESVDKKARPVRIVLKEVQLAAHKQYTQEDYKRKKHFAQKRNRRGRVGVLFK
jgi:hypothetical protein